MKRREKESVSSNAIFYLSQNIQYNFIMDILVIKKKILRQSRYLQPDPVCVVLMMFVLFLISRYFVGDVWSKGGYN